MLSQKKGIKVSRKRVMRLMKARGHEVKKKRRFVVTTSSAHKLEVTANLLERKFTTQEPNQKWVGDITYLKIPGGWLYLSVVIDLFSRFVVGWALSTAIDTALVVAALDMAKKRRGNFDGGLFHSDRGCQYASVDYRNELAKNGMRSSMSRTGDCWDNAVSESWFGTAKTELGDTFESEQQAKRQWFDYIEVFFNQQRSHSTLGYLSPAEFEQRAWKLKMKKMGANLEKPSPTNAIGNQISDLEIYTMLMVGSLSLRRS
jgi:putative transposase